MRERRLAGGEHRQVRGDAILVTVLGDPVRNILRSACEDRRWRMQFGPAAVNGQRAGRSCRWCAVVAAVQHHGSGGARVSRGRQGLHAATGMPHVGDAVRAHPAVIRARGIGIARDGPVHRVGEDLHVHDLQQAAIRRGFWRVGTQVEGLIVPAHRNDQVAVRCQFTQEGGVFSGRIAAGAIGKGNDRQLAGAAHVGRAIDRVLGEVRFDESHDAVLARALRQFGAPAADAFRERGGRGAVVRHRRRARDRRHRSQSQQ